ncbi:hypothetical protein HII12_003279 [Brettanomyces bruxellensis]|uniref:DEBR0S2_16050g1_1 n=1 Tax=Dekkera bruxellensis TaxID=5007 RepID=A0A7D9CX20_DEKBR|nr:hypothetical protein HII12_003279 [Brettanomyces bruxellensis]VUG17774.1 SED5 [Brettanomyces bruxellensis]
MSLNSNIDIQDRTLEFKQCVNTFERQNAKSRKSYSDQTKRQPRSSAINRNQFTKDASKIAKDIARVTESLSKLAQLAKRKQLFNERASDIIELTYVIKQDIFGIEKSLKVLQQKANAKGGSSDKQLDLYNKNVVQLLNTKTKNISEAFRDVLQVRQKSELAQRSRQEQLLATAKPGNGSTAPDASGKHQEDRLQNANSIPYALRSKANGQNASAMSKSSENPFMAPLSGADGTADPAISDITNIGDNSDVLALPNQSQQMLLMHEQDNRYLQERNSAVETIESTINEVGGLFQQLATMVQEQGEVIQRIDDNVEDVSLNIGGAHRELLKYYNSISSNRWLMLKIFGILIIFFLLWVLVS